MIRFIDLRGQIYFDPKENIFAFFDTIDDSFFRIDDCSVWETKEEFISDYNNTNEYIPYPLERFLNLIPDWVK